MPAPMSNTMHPAIIPPNSASVKLDLDPRAPVEGDPPGDPVVVSVDVVIGGDAAEQN